VHDEARHGAAAVERARATRSADLLGCDAERRRGALAQHRLGLVEREASARTRIRRVRSGPRAGEDTR
jgi:hypothetical protein